MNARTSRRHVTPTPARAIAQGAKRTHTRTRMRAPAFALTSAFTLAFTLTACTVGPDYVKPPAPVAATYKELEGTGWKPAQPADTLTRGAWWSIYADPSLDALEQQVASANQNVQAAEARFRAARATVAQYRSNFFPVVSANGAYSRARSSDRT